jgi:hypothetical protein
METAQTLDRARSIKITSRARGATDIPAHDLRNRWLIASRIGDACLVCGCNPARLSASPRGKLCRLADLMFELPCRNLCVSFWGV